MASVKYGSQMSGATWGMPNGDLTYGYLTDLDIEGTAELSEYKDDDGEIVLAVQHGSKTNVSGSFWCYGTPDIDIAAVSAGSQIDIPNCTQKIILTKVKQTFKSDDVMKISFDGVIYTFNDAAST